MLGQRVLKKKVSQERAIYSSVIKGVRKSWKELFTNCSEITLKYQERNHKVWLWARVLGGQRKNRMANSKCSYCFSLEMTQYSP